MIDIQILIKQKRKRNVCIKMVFSELGSAKEVRYKL